MEVIKQLVKMYKREKLTEKRVIFKDFLVKSIPSTALRPFFFITRTQSEKDGAHKPDHHLHYSRDHKRQQREASATRL